MATRNIAFGGGTGKNQIDLIDVAALMLLPLAASFLFGVFTLEITVFGGYDLTQALWTIGGAEISVALIVSSASSGWVLVTNIANSQTEHEPEELAAIVVAILLPVVYVFVPAIESLINWNDLMRLASLLYVSGATVYVSFKA